MHRHFRLAKVAKSANGSYRFIGTCSDDEVDLKQTRLSRACFESFRSATAEHGMPVLNVAHYDDSAIGVCDQLWIDGHQFKNGGTFEDTPLAQAAVQSLLADRDRPVRQIAQSVGFYPREIVYEGDILVYQSGWLEHSALTTVPVNPRTDVGLLLLSAAITRREDAEAIVGKAMAEELEKRAQLKRLRIEGRSLIVPDLPLGTKTEAIMWALCERSCAPEPLLLFADQAPPPPSPLAPSVFLIDRETETWIGRHYGQMDLGTEPVLSLARRVLQSYLRVDLSLSDADVIELMSSKPSYAYLERLVHLLKETIDEETWAAAHRAARGHAGGRAYPASATWVSAEEFEAQPASKLADLTQSRKPGTLARAMLAIIAANERADLPEGEKLLHVVSAVDEFKRAVSGRPPSVMASTTSTDSADLAGDLITHDRLRQIVYGVVLEPGVLPGVVPDDALTVEAGEIERACHRFAHTARQVWIRHQGRTYESCAVESYVAPQDLRFHDPWLGEQLVRRGTWVVGIHVPDPALWRQVEAGELTGFSLRFLHNLADSLPTITLQPASRSSARPRLKFSD